VAVVDLGGTKVRAAIADLRGNLLAEATEATDARGGHAVAAQIGRLVLRLHDQTSLPRERLRRAVVGCPGVPNPSTGAVGLAPNIPGIDEIDFRSEVTIALGCPALLENDVNLAVLGERWLGRGRGHDHLAFLALGTGIGAGIIANGTILRGASGAAGEIGYLPVGADPFEPESLRVGALERKVGTHGIRAAYRELTGHDADLPAIFNAMNDGDRAARTVIDGMIQTMARAVGAIVAVTDPDLVILGGSIGLRAEVVAGIREAVGRCLPKPVRIEPSELGPQAALAGAVALGLSDLHASAFGGGTRPAALPLPVPSSWSMGEAAE
jgi:predicted NBD/HSP70 family sugar kinase